MTTASLARRARYLQSQLDQYRLRREFGTPNLDAQIGVTLDLLFIDEQELAARGLYLHRDGRICDLVAEGSEMAA